MIVRLDFADVGFVLSDFTGGPTAKAWWGTRVAHLPWLNITAVIPESPNRLSTANQ